MPSEAPIAGFWSYARKDDEAEDGRIAQLARDVVAQYELLTGQEIDLFLDRDSLEWGEQWKGAIDNGVRSAAFFVAVMTPRYFKSVACRNELQTFARKAQDLGVNELVLPLKYVSFPDLDESPPDDQLIALATGFQWIDWEELRYADRSSREYRRAVGEMAERIANVNRALDEEAAQNVAEEAGDGFEDEEPPGTLDLMEAAERVLPQWNQTTRALGEEVEAVGDMFNEATADIQKQNTRGGATFAGRVAVARKLARKLTPSAERIHELGMGFADQIHDVDAGVQVMLQTVAAEPPEEHEDVQAICEFLGSIARLAESLRGGLDQMEGMLTAMDQVASQSRDLRGPLSTMREGLTALREGQAVADIWGEIIEGIDLDCTAAAATQLE